MNRKFARWAKNNLNKEFKARVVATTPEFKAELHDEIIGAKLEILNTDITLTLFEDILVKIEKADIATAKIYVRVTGKIDV